MKINLRSLRLSPQAIAQHTACLVGVIATTLIAAGCATEPKYPPAPATAAGAEYQYVIGPLDTVNIIVWPQVDEKQRTVLLAAKLLSVEGTWQSEKGVRSLVAMKLVDHTSLLGALRTSSRDFR